MSDRMCVDKGYNRRFRLGEEAVQNMVGVVPEKTVMLSSNNIMYIHELF